MQILRSPRSSRRSCSQQSKKTTVSWNPSYTESWKSWTQRTKTSRKTASSMRRAFSSTSWSASVKSTSTTASRRSTLLSLIKSLLTKMRRRALLTFRLRTARSVNRPETSSQLSWARSMELNLGRIQTRQIALCMAYQQSSSKERSQACTVWSLQRISASLRSSMDSRCRRPSHNFRRWHLTSNRWWTRIPWASCLSYHRTHGMISCSNKTEVQSRTN